MLNLLSHPDREDASSMVTAGATANTTEGNSRASRETGLLCSHSHESGVLLSVGVCVCDLLIFLHSHGESIDPQVRRAVTEKESGMAQSENELARLRVDALNVKSHNTQLEAQLKQYNLELAERDEVMGRFATTNPLFLNHMNERHLG